MEFPSPIGLAAGFDKDAQRFRDMYRFDFGSVEVGTLTPRPQKGNRRKRISRLKLDNAVINRMGFPNCGMDAAVRRLANFAKRPGPLGVNIGANADSVDKIRDYVLGYRAVANVADYVTINVSSPNTPGLRSLESGQGLSDLLQRLNSEIEEIGTPLFLKVSPDLSPKQVQDTCAALLVSKVSAVIVGNTTVQRPEGLKADTVDPAGGLSGEPLAPISEGALESYYSILRNKLPIVSVGGVATAANVYRRICKGASLVQLYTAFIYEGPYAVKRMNAELNQLLIADGHTSISSAVGSKVARTPDRARRTSSTHLQSTLRPDVSRAVA